MRVRVIFKILFHSHSHTWADTHIIAKKRNVREFLHGTKDILKIGEDPVQVQFPIVGATELIHRQKPHGACIIKFKRVRKTAIHAQFSSKLKRINWQLTFINFLR